MGYDPKEGYDKFDLEDEGAFKTPEPNQLEPDPEIKSRLRDKAQSELKSASLNHRFHNLSNPMFFNKNT